MGILLLLGLWHGLLRGLFRLLAWAAALAGAYFANNLFAATVADSLGCSGFSATIVCVCIGFLIPFLLFLFISHIINKSISETVVGKVDRILGAFFGVVKALMICFVLLSIMHVLPFGGIIKETRDTAVAYDIYKSSLETLGYSSEPVDLVDAAEKKASEVAKNMADKAAEKATEVAKEATDKAAEAAKEAVADAAKKAIQSVTEQKETVADNDQAAAQDVKGNVSNNEKQ